MLDFLYIVIFKGCLRYIYKKKRKEKFVIQGCFTRGTVKWLNIPVSHSDNVIHTHQNKELLHVLFNSKKEPP